MIAVKKRVSNITVDINSSKYHFRVNKTGTICEDRTRSFMYENISNIRLFISYRLI